MSESCPPLKLAESASVKATLLSRTVAASFSVTLSVATTLPRTGASFVGATLTTTDCAAEVPPSPSETVRLMVRAAGRIVGRVLVGNVFDQLLNACGIRKPREIEHQGFAVGTVCGWC